MFNLRAASFLLLCSALYMQASDKHKQYGYDEGKYKISCIEKGFEGEDRPYHVMIEPRTVKNSESIIHWIKLVRAAALQRVVFNYQGTWEEIYKRIGDCSVNLSCVNIHDGTKLKIGDFGVEEGIKAGTHELRATTVRIDGTSCK